MTANATSGPELSRPRRLVLLSAVGLGLIAIGSIGLYWALQPPATLPPELPEQKSATTSGPGASGPAWFRDVTSGSGIDFTHRNGDEAQHFTILESMGGGIALLDYDGDGLLDVFVTGGGYFAGPDKTTIQGHPCKLYRNLGGLRFQDVTKEVGLDIAWWYTNGVAVADYDRDGWPDFVVTGYGRLALFHNEPNGKGGRCFVEVTQKVGLRDDSWSTSAGWADLDGDGFPELYVCHYLDWSFANNPICKGFVAHAPRDVCPPQKFKPLVHALFKNNKGQTFRNEAMRHGFPADGAGLGVVLADVNDDGRPDIYVANDGERNFLFYNRGGKLEEKGMLAGAAVDDTGHYNGSMGTDVGDYDGSGRPSAWVTNFQGQLHALYGNLGQELFQHQSRVAGVGALGRHLVGFGTSFVDVDNDGWEDLVIAHGHVLRYPTFGSTYTQKPVLLHNSEYQGRRFFKDISPQGGAFFQAATLGRGLAVGDLDNDGWPDLVISHMNSPVAVLRNAATAVHQHHWLGIRLVGKDHRDVVGSTVILEGKARKLTRFAKGGGSYLSASDARILFGLGESKRRQRVTVQWSWGAMQTWENLEPDNYWTLHEGQTTPRRS